MSITVKVFSHCMLCIWHRNFFPSRNLRASGINSTFANKEANTQSRFMEVCSATVCNWHCNCLLCYEGGIPPHFSIRFREGNHLESFCDEYIREIFEWHLSAETIPCLLQEPCLFQQAQAFHWSSNCPQGVRNRQEDEGLYFEQTSWRSGES